MILIIDYGSQYTHLLSSTVRYLGYDTTICYDDEDITKYPQAKVVILSGGPYSVYDTGAPQLHLSVLASGLPLLGICYGHQLLQYAMGGKVISSDHKEYGKAMLAVDTTHPIFQNLDTQEQMRMSHGDEVSELAPGFVGLASTKDCPYACIGHTSLPIYGVQFHPEVAHSLHGTTLLKNFLEQICAIPASWSMDHYLPLLQQDILAQVGDKRLCMLVSGGVDSSVAYSIIAKTIGQERCYGFLIDTGLMRKGEVEAVKVMMQEQGFLHFYVHDASGVFFQALEGIADPEQKRKIIGALFIQEQQKIIEQLGREQGTWLLGQGTIYPDVIESQGTRHAHLIKTHHNRVQIIQDMIAQGLVIEPLQHLYKHEVRSLARSLGLPEIMIARHPFPGPGLAIRLLCNETPGPAIQKSWELNGFDAHLLAIRSVGAQGDARSYKHPCFLQGNYDAAILPTISQQITNTHTDCNRVIFVLDTKKSLDVQQLQLHAQRYVTSERTLLLQDIDAIVTQWMQEFGYYETIWQMPVVLLPLGDWGETIVLRPIQSRDAMTAEVVYTEYSDLMILSKRILAHGGIDMVCLDSTNKPPATIEWE